MPPAPAGAFGYRCSRCGDHASGGWSSACVLVIAARHGGAKHAFAATYDGFGAAETAAGERVHLTQFRERWADIGKYDLELRFTPAAAEIYCAGAPEGAPPKAPVRACAPKGLAPQRSLRALRETLVNTKDVLAATPAPVVAPVPAPAPAPVAAAPAPAPAAATPAAAAPAAAAAAVPALPDAAEEGDEGDGPESDDPAPGGKRGAAAAAPAAAGRGKRGAAAAAPSPPAAAAAAPARKRGKAK
jgi:hypothetical protein